MTDIYEPQAEFLTWVLSGDAPLTGSPFAETNLRRVIALMNDAQTANRDWATFILALAEVDGDEVRTALMAATKDVDAVVRGEALLGLAMRDRDLALPLVRRELEGDEWGSPTFEAAELLADPSLLGALRRCQGTAKKEWMNREIADAIVACERAITPD
ncbi:hypothetical protein [Tsuneonella dongtanensis]|uniref:hypothetical protein n=1 Tax=Tsuneonella dongtanensis TaxID=692370 RepID=UPI000836E546|nr:hypothetical protein [Tsuneonella dongtanensis]